MKAANWNQVELLFHKALALGGEKRESFLRQNCGDDDDLLAEVGSLLSAHDRQEDFLDDAILDLGFAVINEGDKKASLEGRTIGSYELKRKLGEGGMGTVYLARDHRLHREVALKFLSSTYLDNEILKKQLLREAQAAANLDHPNICPIYSVEEIDDFNFIVMPYLTGESLADLIRAGELFSAEELMEIITQIVAAVGAAHSQGVLHRDIKPGNVMRTSDGRIEMLDFGLAKVISPVQNRGVPEDAKLTDESAGLVFGTVSYMSPEQLRKERLDYRSDIFSLGTLIYELCTLRNPFAKESQAETISSVLSETPDYDLLDRSSASPGLRNIIRRCLEKNKERRYSSATEVLIDLDLSKNHVRASRTIASQAGRWFFAVLTVLALSIGGGLFWKARSSKLYRVAVLPLANSTSDSSLDYLGPGISEGIINRLARNSKSTEVSVKTFTQVSGYTGSADPSAAGRQLGADIVVSGSIGRDDDRLVATVHAIDVSRGEELWSEADPIETDDLLVLQARITEHIATSLQISTVEGASQFREKGEAYRHYLIGQHYWKKRDPDNIQKAILSFNQAIELDPTYAKAYAGLANAYVVQSLVAYGAIPSREAMTKARAAAKQAIEIDPENSEAHTALAVILFKYDWSWAESENEFRRAIGLNADYSAAHYWYASLLAILGRRDESIAEALLARDLDPFSPLVHVNLARAYYYGRQFDNAADVLRRAREDGFDDSKIRYLQGLVLVQQNKFGEALPLFKAIYSENKLFASAALGFTYARMGKEKEAVAIVSDLERNTQDRSVPSQEIAVIFAGMNQSEKAVRYLQGAFNDRHAALVSVAVEPLFDSLRKNPDFLELLKAMHLGDI